jgi:hypothetical protein
MSTLWKFYRQLHQRTTLRELANHPVLQTKASHLSEVFCGKRGANSRKHIAPLLTEEERALLDPPWDERGNLLVRNCEVVLHETNSQL